jgi:hypothetical protein
MMDREAALHFRDQLRAARSVALRDAEAHQEIVLTLERLGAYLYGKMATLNSYQGVIAKLAEHSPMATRVPSSLPDLHSTFTRKYEIFRRGRNATVHQGAFARHLTVNAVELSLVLEEALMHGYDQVGDFMVRNPVCAYLWQPLSFVRQAMLSNSFSYLPVLTGSEEQPVWQVVSDSNLVRYLRVNGEISTERLMKKLSQAIDHPAGLKLIPVQQCGTDQRLDALSRDSDGLPTLVLSPDGRSLLGILTPFDLL